MKQAGAAIAKERWHLIPKFLLMDKPLGALACAEPACCCKEEYPRA